MNSRPKVVIIGAGFGGLAAARHLEHAAVDVVIVDQHNFHTFQPLLYQVATSGLNTADVAYAVRGIFQRQHNVTFRQGRVTGVEWDSQRLLLDDGTAIAFDFVVVAAGAVTHYFNVDGAADHAFPLYSLDDAVALRNHVLARFEAADADRSLVDDGALTFVVVGGGPTGVEVAGALSELFAMVLRKDFRTLDVERARIVLIEMTDRLLPPFSPSSATHATKILRERGVEVCTGEAVARVTPTRVTLASGRVINAHTLIWAAGVKANPLAAALGVETGRGDRIPVSPDLRIAGHPNAFAVGDVAAIGAGGDSLLPMLAPVAMQSGKHAALEIVRAIEGRTPRPFHYRDKGTMATIGRRSAVAELPLRIRLWGTPAWFAWLGLHLLFLIGVRNRLSVFLNWVWSYFTYDRGPRLIFFGPAPRHGVPSATRPGVPTRSR